MRSYTALFAYMRTTVPVCCRLLAFFFGCLVAACGQQSPDAWPAAPFVTQILAKAGTPATISLRFENKSSLDASSFKSIRRAIEEEVRRRKLRVVPAESAIAECRITVSENMQSLLWIAEIKEGLTSSYVMLSVPARASAASRPRTLSLRDSVTWFQDEPILDFAKVDVANVLVLTPSHVAYLIRDAEAWREIRRQALRYDRQLPRDPHGKLVLNGNVLEAYLPGLHCGAQITEAEVSCVQVDDPWPLDPSGSLRAFYAANRNFFTGALANSQSALPPFYSAARTVHGGQPVWILAGTNGLASMYGDFSRPLATFGDWGSELASLRSGCGRDELIVSRPGDRSQKGAIQAVELTDGEAVPSTAPLEFPGPVLSLASASDLVSAVVFNLQTRQYEAHVITVACE